MLLKVLISVNKLQPASDHDQNWSDYQNKMQLQNGLCWGVRIVWKQSIEATITFCGSSAAINWEAGNPQPHVSTLTVQHGGKLIQEDTQLKSFSAC